MSDWKELHFTITIDAPREKVWQTMLGAESYPQWTGVSWPGSRYVGEWKKGTSIRFVGDGGGGTLADIVELEPNRSVQMRHVAVLGADGSEDRDSDVAKGWIGSTEGYRFSDEGGRTRVDIDMVAPAAWETMFRDGWPAALSELKALSER